MLGALVRPSSTRVRLMAVLDLRAYFDESGTTADSKQVVVAVHLAPTADWIALEDAWREVLASAGAPFYHATDAEATRPQGIYRGWTKRKTRNLTDRMASIIGSNLMLKAIGVRMAAEHWLSSAEKAKPYFPKKELDRFPKNPFIIPYYALVKFSIDITMKQLKPELEPSLPPEETVAFIFEDNDWKYPVLVAYEMAKKRRRLGERFGTIVFEEKRRFPGLQAADLLAWGYRKSALRLERGEYSHGAADRSLRIMRSLVGMKQDYSVFSTLDGAKLGEVVEEAAEQIFSGKIS